MMSRAAGTPSPEVLIHSSNIATAQIADQLGKDRMEAMFHRLHFDGPPDIELKERGHPIWPTYWARTTVMTTAYGHGIAITPLQLATAYAALVNGGIWRPATLMKLTPAQVPQGSRVFSQAASDRMRQLLRMTVQWGTGKFANADGLRVGGKTGTAERPTGGGYFEDAAGHDLRRRFPDGRAALCRPDHARQSQGQRGKAMASAPPPTPPPRSPEKSLRGSARCSASVPTMVADIDTTELLPLVAKAQVSAATQ